MSQRVLFYAPHQCPGKVCDYKGRRVSPGCTRCAQCCENAECKLERHTNFKTTTKATIISHVTELDIVMHKLSDPLHSPRMHELEMEVLRVQKQLSAMYELADREEFLKQEIKRLKSLPICKTK
jgi:hypothetical protein